jgi:hypothetical protein
MVEAWDHADQDPWRLLIRAAGLGAVAWDRRFDLFEAIAARTDRTRPKWRSIIWGEIALHRRRDQLPLGAFRALGMELPEQARVRRRTAGRSSELPRFIELSDEFLWFLGLYVAEGCRHEGPKSALITLSCDDATLDRAAKVLERTFDPHMVRSQGSSKRSPALTIHSKLLLLLLDELGFEPGPKRLPGWVLGLPRTRLKWVLEGYREGDGVHSGAKFDEGQRHEFSTTSTELKDDLIVALGRFGLLPSVGLYETTFKQRTGERRYPFWRLTLCNVAPWSPLDWDTGVAQRLNARRSGDLVWAEVRQIVEVPPTPLVYDFCVPGRENFWAGTGVMVHNTFGPHMRLDDGRAFANFAVQALSGEPLTVYGDGSQTRSLCYVDDLIEGIYRLLLSDCTGPMNLGNPQECTIRELAERIAAAARSTAGVVHRDRPVDDPQVRKPDISLAIRELGWKPQVSLDEGIRRTLPWFEEALRR